LGYGLDPPQLGISDDRLNSEATRRLTKVLILHPIAAGLAGLAFLFGMCGAAYHRTGTIFMTIVSALATLVTLVIFIIDVVIFTVARNRIRNNGLSSELGNALWLTLGALAALLIGFCVSICGIFGRYRKRRSAATY
jgi:hypothetical protein